MSVTFWCPDAPRKQVPCQFCQGEYVDFPEGNGRGGKCDRFCTGFTEESEAPEVNVANGNAVGILSLLGFQVDACGYMYGSCTAALMRQRLFRARNLDRSALERGMEIQEGGHAGVRVVDGEDGLPTIQRMGPTFIVGGNTDEQTLGRLARLEQLALYAQERGYEITWG